MIYLSCKIFYALLKSLKTNAQFLRIEVVLSGTKFSEFMLTHLILFETQLKDINRQCVVYHYLLTFSHRFV